MEPSGFQPPASCQPPRSSHCTRGDDVPPFTPPFILLELKATSSCPYCLADLGWKRSQHLRTTLPVPTPLPSPSTSHQSGEDKPPWSNLLQQKSSLCTKLDLFLLLRWLTLCKLHRWQQPPPTASSWRTASPKKVWPPPKPFLHVAAAGFGVGKDQQR